MLTVTFTQLRNNAKKYFDVVERGEVIEVYRRGKPVALLSPYRKGAGERWRQNFVEKRRSAMKLKGISLSKAILAARKESR